MLKNIAWYIFKGTIENNKEKIQIFVKINEENYYSSLGLGAFLVERSFFPENERNDQERYHRSEKNERSERVLEILERLVKERNGKCLKRTVKIVNAF